MGDDNPGWWLPCAGLGALSYLIDVEPQHLYYGWEVREGKCHDIWF